VREWNVGAIEQAFVDAAVDPSRWNAAMEIVSEMTGGDGAGMFPLKGPIPVFLPLSQQMAAGHEPYFRGGWDTRDDRFRSFPILRRRGVVTELDFTTAEEMDRHPYYQEFLAPLKWRWFAGVLVASGDDEWCVSIQRSIKQGPFLPNEQAELVRLSKALSSAAALARALGFASSQAALDAFELSGTAVVLLNRRGEIMKLNKSAESILGAGIRVSKKRLISNDPNATSALDRALHTLLWSNTGSSLLPPIALPRTNCRPLLAYPLKLASVTANYLADCRALLVLVDPEKRSYPPETALRTGFGLTGAEARLAARLATGKSIEAVADELGVAKETARNQLKSIFSKTGVHRQAELVALFASLIGRTEIKA
jgi:DNA-binding CsgD family transcriptional regulator